MSKYFIYWILTLFVIILIAVLLWYAYKKDITILYNKLIKSDTVTRITNNDNYKVALQAIRAPSMNPKWQAFHQNLYVRVFRFLGGLCTLFVVFRVDQVIFISSYILSINYFVASTFLTYMLLLNAHRFYYVVRSLLRGDTIHKTPR